jgi:ribose-phosphate pyrophosphokinase
MKSYIFTISNDNKSIELILENLHNLCVMDGYSNNNIPIKGEIEIQKFSDGEMAPLFKHSIRGCRVYLYGSLDSPESILTMNLAVDAAKRASASEVCCVIPYLGYMRQDRKGDSRTTIGSKVIINMLENSGCDRFIVVDLHAEQIEGFFSVPVDNVKTQNLFETIIKKYIDNNPNTLISLNSPDAGGTKRVDKYWRSLAKNNDKISTSFFNKYRDKPNSIGKMILVGDVKDRTVFIIDDMIDTGGTLSQAAQQLMDNGAKGVISIATHPVLSGNAHNTLNESCISLIILSNTIQKSVNTIVSDKILFIRIENEIAKFIIANQEGISPSEIKGKY